MIRTIQGRLRLLLASVVLVGGLTTLLSVAMISRGSFSRFIADSDLDRARLLARTLEDVYEASGSQGNLEQLMPPPPQQRSRPPMMPGPHMLGMMGLFPERVIVTDQHGKVVSDSAPSKESSRHSPGDGVPIGQRGREVGRVFVGSMISPALSPFQSRFLHSLGMGVGLSWLISALLAYVLGALLVRTISAPLKKLSWAAGEIARGDFSVSLPPEGALELRELAASFNSMIGSLQRTEIWRRQIIADIAHELKTPLTLLQGTLEAMADGLYALSMDNVKTLQDETKQLSRLIGDLGELSVMESGRPRLELETVDLCEIARLSAAAFEAALRDKRIGLALRLAGDAPPIEADPGRLVQVLRNLFANSIKYCPPGSLISISVGPERGACVLEFSDDGPGIPAEDLPHVFERFYRVDKSRTRGTGGSGLGLAIVRGIVEAHGGRVEALSPVNGGATGGTTIRISLPVK